MARNAKFLKLKLNPNLMDPSKVEIADIFGKVKCNYEITDRTQKQAKLSLEIFIQNHAEEVIHDLDTVTDASLEGCLQVNANTTNELTLAYDTNYCILADESGNAKISFSFILPGKVLGTLGNTKTPGTVIDSSIN